MRKICACGNEMHSQSTHCWECEMAARDVTAWDHVCTCADGGAPDPQPRCEAHCVTCGGVLRSVLGR
jgi:hypothetical protein